MSISPSIKAVTKQNYSITDVMNTLKIVRNDIHSINAKLLTQENTSSAILARMDTLTAEIIALKKENENLKKDVADLKNNSRNSLQSLNSINDIPSIDLVDEIQEREMKSRNLLIFNIDEPNCNECELADDLIKNLNIDVSISSVVRLGKQSIPGPIRITFDSPQVVLTVLKSKKHC